MAISRLRQMVALLLLVFLNQWAVASTMHCFASSADVPVSHAAAVDDHHAHHRGSMQEQNDLPNTPADCCKTVNHCLSAGSCSLPPLAYDLFAPSATRVAVSAAFPEDTAPPSPISSLFRPPIFR